MCVCVCNQRNAKVVAMVVFFQQCTYFIYGLHVFEKKKTQASGLGSNLRLESKIQSIIK